MISILSVFSIFPDFLFCPHVVHFFLYFLGNAMLFLPPGESAFYTWINPQGDRTLIWGHDLSKASHEFENLLVTDGQGLIDLGPNKCLAWVSFLDGMQRVLLFTEDPDRCWRLTQNFGEIERIAMVISLPF